MSRDPGCAAGGGLSASVKKNQSALADVLEAAFPVAKIVSFEGDAYVTDEKKRGRQESCYHIASDINKYFSSLAINYLTGKRLGW